ncbi:MAG: tetratricopeptide repeat protein [Pyrinomonadaceae bacterium]
MFGSNFTSSRALLVTTSLLFLSCYPLRASPYLQAQSTENYDTERRRAFQLFEEQKLIAALPILEKLAAANPSDVVVMERLGISILANSATIQEPTARKQERNRARTVLLRAQQLGDNSNLLRNLLDGLPPGGGEETSFSGNREAEAAMNEGERAYALGDLDKALAAYKLAHKIDPTLYQAPLFAGDMLFKKKEWDKAGEWFARAIAINPNVETAYRYWGDALMGKGKMDEARDKLIDAIIAEPYRREAHVGLIQWAQRNNVKLAHPHIQPPTALRTEGNNTTLAVDPKILNSQGGSNAWLMYDLTRTAWAKGDFARAYPNEKVYRHSLREEAAALRMVANAAAKDLQSGKIKSLEPSLATLVKLNDAGLLEAYILLARADQGIARDYAAYRQENRDKLRRYLTEYVAPANR